MSHIPRFVFRLWYRGAPIALLGAALALAACSTAGPPPVTYVLGEPASPVQSAEPLTGRPVIEVRPVLVPDYLDVADILIRQGGHMVAPSPTGRWGERLSAGVTRALAAGLARRLPDLVIVTSPPVEPPSRQVLVDVATFEPSADGKVVLVAQWRVLDGDSGGTLTGERVSLEKPIAGTGDPAVVAAMSSVTEELADHVAAGIERSGPAMPPTQ